MSDDAHKMRISPQTGSDPAQGLAICSGFSQPGTMNSFTFSNFSPLQAMLPIKNPLITPIVVTC